LLEILADIKTSEQVKTRHFPVLCSHHSEGLSRAGLAIGETCSVGAFKSADNQRLNTFLINLQLIVTINRKDDYLLVIGFMAEDIIKLEFVKFHILCQIYFLPIQKVVSNLKLEAN
jgi:hypothetical protein